MKTKGYNDLFFRLLLSFVAAHTIVAFGAKESFFTLLLSADYYRSLLGSFIIAFLLVQMVYWATVKLDKRYDWGDGFAGRAGLQCLFGLLASAIAAFLLATVYFRIFGIDILDTNYLRFDFPVVVLMLLLLNLYYLCFYFYRQWKENQPGQPATTNAGRLKNIFIAIRGNKNIPVPVEDIAYFYHRSDCNFLRTFSEEDFVINQSLEDIQRQFSQKQFFRVNRQLLANIRSCRHFETIENQKLKLHVSPKLHEEVIISQKRAREFKEWINS